MKWKRANAESFQVIGGSYSDFLYGDNSSEYKKNFEKKLSEITIIDMSTQLPIMTLPNVRDLFIQGCSFRNLEKGSQWSEEGLAILKQYNAKDVSICDS